MDFGPVPAGTQPHATLVLRGAEHDVVADVQHQMVAQCASFTRPVLSPGAAAERMMQYSNVAGALGSSLFTEDPNVLDATVGLTVIVPTRLEQSRAQYVIEGLSDTAAHDSVGSFLSSVEDVISALDLDTINAAHLVAAGDLYDTEPPVTVAGGLTAAVMAQTFRCRAITYRQHAAGYPLPYDSSPRPTPPDVPWRLCVSFDWLLPVGASGCKWRGPSPVHATPA